jgi:hypothetical protein
MRVVVVHLSPLSTRVFDVFSYAYRPNSSSLPPGVCVCVVLEQGRG